MMDWLPLELLGPIALLAALLGGRVAMHWLRRYRGTESPTQKQYPKNESWGGRSHRCRESRTNVAPSGSCPDLRMRNGGAPIEVFGF